MLLNFINENNNKDLVVLNVVYKCRWDIPPASCFETHPELLLLDLVSDLIIIMLSLMPEIFCSWALLLLSLHQAHVGTSTITEPYQQIYDEMDLVPQIQKKPKNFQSKIFLFQKRKSIIGAAPPLLPKHLCTS